MKALREELAALAAGLCQDTQIGILIHQGPWAWDPSRRLIKVPEEDLQRYGTDYCAGRLADEVGHFFLTRFDQVAEEQEELAYGHWLEAEEELLSFPGMEESWRIPEGALSYWSFPSHLAARALMAALEIPRVESWMSARYPGTGRWFQRVAKEEPPPEPWLPSFLLFCRACSAEGRRSWLPSEEELSLPIRVRNVLARTREARRAYANTLPAAELELPKPDPKATARLYALQPEALAWTRWEQIARSSALEALQLAEEEILPAAMELIDADLSFLEDHLRERPELRREARDPLSERMSDLFQKIWKDGRVIRHSGPPPWDLQQLSLSMLEQLLESELPLVLFDSPAPLHWDGPQIFLPGPPLEWDWGQRSAYDEAYDKVSSQVEQLLKHLESILIPRERLREKSGYPSGRRIDLRRAMAFEADPRRYQSLWIRSSIPDRRNIAISLLIDLSGSMEGEKAISAVLGTILMAETLVRLKTPFEVNGFQDLLIPFCGFGEPFTDSVRSSIVEMPLEVEGNRPGGNNLPIYNDDGPCLMSAAERLIEHPASDRLMIVVSDGLPEGRHSNADDLRRVIEELTQPGVPLQLIALGLGPKTHHVNGFYPEAVADVPVDHFADEIGAIIERVLLA